MGHCRKRRVYTPEEQQVLDAVWSNPAYSKRAKRAFTDAVQRFAMDKGPIEVVEPFDIFKRDHWRCKRCGKLTQLRVGRTLEQEQRQPHNLPTLDHILPIGQGGCHVASNCQLLCYECNDAKQNNLESELPPPKAA
jgi:hypothetical protein